MVAESVRLKLVALCWAGLFLLGIATIVISLPENRFSVERSLGPADQQHAITIAPSPNERWLRLGLFPASQNRLVAFTAQLGTRGIAANRAAPPAAIVFLVPLDRDGHAHWDASERVAELRRTQPPRSFTKQIYLEDGCDTISVIGQVNLPEGAVDIIGMRADLLAATPFYESVRPLLIALWATLAGLVVVLCFGAAKRPGFATIAVMVGALLYGGTLMPRTFVRLGSDGLKDLWTRAERMSAARETLPPTGARASVGESRPGDRDWPVQPEKLAHLALCLALAYVARRGFLSHPRWLVLLTLLALVAPTEILQSLTEDRDPSLRDVGIDALGLVIGFAAATMAGGRKAISGVTPNP